MIEKFYSGEIDLIISQLDLLRDAPDDIVCKFAFKGKMYLMLPKGHPLCGRKSLSLSDMTNLHIASLKHNIFMPAVNLLREWFRANHYDVSIYSDESITNLNTLQTYVVAKNAVGLVTWNALETTIDNRYVELVAVEEHYPGHDFYIAYRKKNEEKLKPFLECI